ncbi:hypothetical protein [Hydrogenophaga sp. PAMC20947]|uniref:FFLEELY motif protein n=1 Tax=Hydrogenophaga sp. PAMC20947 TaxID=2565558 RepID=UPI001FF739AD|nr:hypothetical protein [Hydrogenophaga sp. PAMC20947]
MNATPSTAEAIRAQLARVQHLRDAAGQGPMAAALQSVKRLQAQRFKGTYADFLRDPRYATATQFFLDELYGEHDFADRDQQFGRIAGAIERLFPDAVGQLAVDLAETHALTESLDHQMAEHWVTAPAALPQEANYIRCWRLTGRPADRTRQLAVVLHMGSELQRLTRMKSLLFALKMMRQPAQAAGLGALQQFLERGFLAFAHMRDAASFMEAIAERESAWIEHLFHGDTPTCQQALLAEISVP